MSYILNALRKSEQERHSRQAPTLENRVMGNQEPQKHWKPWLIIALITINLITLSFFFWQNQQTSDPVAESIVNSDIVTQTTPSASSELVGSRKNASSEIETGINEFPLKKTPEKIQPSISERVGKKSSSSAKLAQKPTLEEKVSSLEDYTNKEGITVLKQTGKSEGTVKNIKTVKPGSAEQEKPAKPQWLVSAASSTVKQEDFEQEKSSIKSTPVKTVNDKNRQEITGQKRKTSTVVTAKTSASAGKSKAVSAAKPAVKKAAKPKIPFLEQFPVAFRRKFPDLNINVFVYSEDPEDSFIMVDMVKYIPGQDISENTKLKKIQRNSMVVEFEGKKVRIRRP